MAIAFFEAGTGVLIRRESQMANTVYTYVKEYQTGDIIFRQGEKSVCMYEVQKGAVDLYSDYGRPDQKKLAEIEPDRFFGEMGMVEGLPRSATAVAAVDHTVVAEVNWDVFGHYFKSKPARVVQIMQQMGDRLRVTTRAAMDLRNTVDNALEVIQKDGANANVQYILKSGISRMDQTLGGNK